MKLGMQVRLGPGHILLDGDLAHPPQKGHSPPMFSHYLCDQKVGWIKMPLGREIGIGPGHIVLDGDPAPPKEHSPNFPPMCIVAKWQDG